MRCICLQTNIEISLHSIHLYTSTVIKTLLYTSTMFPIFILIFTPHPSTQPGKETVQHTLHSKTVRMIISQSFLIWQYNSTTHSEIAQTEGYWNYSQTIHCTQLFTCGKEESKVSEKFSSPLPFPLSVSPLLPSFPPCCSTTTPPVPLFSLSLPPLNKREHRLWER